MSKLSLHSHPGHHGTDLLGRKQVRDAESRGLAPTQGSRISSGPCSLELMFPELSGSGNRQYPCEGVKL